MIISENEALKNIESPFGHPSCSFFAVTSQNRNLKNLDLDAMGLELPEKLQKAVAKRQWDFIAGRYCAGHALQDIGSEFIQLGINDDRSANWPEGFVGSITHTYGFALACVASSEKYSGIGLDSEWIQSPDRILSFSHQFSSQQEQEKVVDAGLPLEAACFLIFSAKESLYKCLYPSVKRFFGFGYASLIAISLDPDRNCGSFSIQLQKELEPFSEGREFEGRFSWTPGQYIHTFIWEEPEKF